MLVFEWFFKATRNIKIHENMKTTFEEQNESITLLKWSSNIIFNARKQKYMLGNQLDVQRQIVFLCFFYHIHVVEGHTA